MKTKVNLLRFSRLMASGAGRQQREKRLELATWLRPSTPRQHHAAEDGRRQD